MWQNAIRQGEKGTINTWNNDRQFGFVSCDSGRGSLAPSRVVSLQVLGLGLCSEADMASTGPCATQGQDLFTHAEYITDARMHQP